MKKRPAVLSLLLALACRTAAPDRTGDASAAVSSSPLAESAARDRSAKWDAVFRDGGDFTPQPSQYLAEVVSGRPPGAALDVGMGQGRNALYLASRGWKVTGVDISDEGLRLAREAAAARGLPLTTVRADVDTWDFGAGKWDLVALIFFGPDAKMVPKLRASVKQGGLVVVEHFHKGAFADDPGRGYGGGELAALFADGFRVVRDDVLEAPADWGGEPGTRRLVERFAAERR